MTRERSGEEIEAIYDRWAFVYDTFTWLTEGRSLRRALDLLEIRDGESLLEIAVGTGVAFRDAILKNPSGTNVGIDLTEAMLKRARKKAARTGVAHELLIADARALSFSDASFDVVMSFNMLGLIPESEIAAILREMFRVLRPGGRASFVTMRRPEKKIAEAFYDVVVIRLGGWRDIDIAPFVRAVGFEIAEKCVVTQRGVPSEVLLAKKPA